MKLSLVLVAAAAAASSFPDDNPPHPPPNDPLSALLLGRPFEGFGDTDPSLSSSDGMPSSIMDTDSTNVGGGGLLVRYAWLIFV